MSFKVGFSISNLLETAETLDVVWISLGFHAKAPALETSLCQNQFVGPPLLDSLAMGTIESDLTSAGNQA